MRQDVLKDKVITKQDEEMSDNKDITMNKFLD